MLLEVKIDREGKNIENKTPLECAIAMKNISIVNTLLEAGANIGNFSYTITPRFVNIF